MSTATEESNTGVQQDSGDQRGVRDPTQTFEAAFRATCQQQQDSGQKCYLYITDKKKQIQMYLIKNEQNAPIRLKIYFSEDGLN